MSYMKYVARILGVELGEKFNIVDKEKEYTSFMFTNDGLHKVYEDGTKSLTCSCLMESLLNGKMIIKQRPRTALIVMNIMIE